MSSKQTKSSRKRMESKGQRSSAMKNYDPSIDLKRAQAINAAAGVKKVQVTKRMGG